MAHWTVVGGEQTGGLVVRQGVELSSAKLKERLETGARVAQVELQGERLRFRRLEGHGPETGWVSLKLKEKPLLLPAASLPQAVTSVSELFGGRLEVECLELPKHLRVRVATISDIHVDQKANMEWFQKHLPRKAPDDFNVLLLPGDVSDDPVIFKEAMKMLIESFDVVCYTPGNHDLWLRKSGDCSDSLAKLRQLRRLCEGEESELRGRVRFSPLELKTEQRSLLLLPLLSFYTSDWDQEPDLPWCPQQQKQMLAWMDFRTMKWPELGSSGDSRKICFGPEGTKGLSELFAEMNEPVLEQVAQIQPSTVLSFSHYLPRQELFPEKRFLLDSSLHKVSGSLKLEEQIRRVKPDVHVFGHTHLTVDMVLDGQRYVQWALGTPREQAAMSRAVADSGMLILYDSMAEPCVAPVQETFWGQYFSAGKRDPSQICPAPFVQKYFGQMFKELELPYDDDFFQTTPNPGPPIETYEGLFEPRWRF